jgi:hypothetical protein
MRVVLFKARCTGCPALASNRTLGVAFDANGQRPSQAPDPFRYQQQRREGRRHWISGTPGRAVPSRFGRSLGSGMCPGLRGCGQFPLAPRCLRLARPGPHPVPSSRFTSCRGESTGPNLRGGGVPGIGIEPAQFPSSSQGSQFVLFAVEGATVRCSLCVWGDNKGCT